MFSKTNLDIPIPELDTVTKAKVIQELLDVKDRIKEMPDWTYMRMLISYLKMYAVFNGILSDFM